MTPKLILCDCLSSQPVDGETIAEAAGVSCSRILTHACGADAAHVAEMMIEGPVVMACQQEARFFEELAVDADAPAPRFVDLRDRAGWSDEGDDSAPKMAALAAEALITSPPERTIDIVSEGVCLIIGSGEVAQKAARDLSGVLAVTLLSTTLPENDPGQPFDVVSGTLARAQGTLGQFALRIDGFRQQVAGGRQASWTEPRDGAQSACDLILDLSGGAPLFPAHEKRDGYLRADPGSQPAVAAAVLEASQMVGTFEKPLYVRLEETLCAHSRAEQTGCSNCLDVCPTGAITSAGDHVSVDPLICAGCGACSALCPSGAISYDAPPVASVFARLHTLASTFRAAGGEAPRLLVHDDVFGREMIALAARHGRGLPADVVPLSLPALASFGHAEMLAARASGFTEVQVLLAPKSDRETLAREAALACAIAGDETLRLLDVANPDALSDALYAQTSAVATTEPILPLGNRRQVTRLAAKALRPEAEQIALPDAAPYGAILVDKDACTLCLSCVSLCPAGALGDNSDKPQLRFQEDACLQCGICATICPEDAITLAPQLDLTDAAFTQRVVHEEEPFACVDCGKLFGSKSTVERIMEKLAGKHAMFASGEAARMIQMCDTCRIQAQAHSENSPFAGAPRPRVRTSDDYFTKRKDH
ncbi:4Fe-4S binding protein [uncultured Roseobacter sp.]|uniref:4Fe-4S binding protein n=1 Tax=uncultured Roseobacter sp. TaxID=114847 RepID=UPI00261F544B|nr:4Fe-4S binding protein [uncultured Roseobacter sp.]